MKDILIEISKETRMVNISKSMIGIDNENLQNNLVFKFTDEFVNGTARLEYVLNRKKHFILLKKEQDRYIIPIKNILLKKGQINMQLVITESETDEGIPVFKSNIFYVKVNEAINADSEAPDEYQQWIDIANAKLSELDDAIDDCVDAGNYATIQGNFAKETAEELLEAAEEGKFNGKDALINGVNTITINGGTNIELQQQDGVLTINNTYEFDDRDIQTHLNSLEELTQELDRDLSNAQNDIESLEQELQEQEETLNHLGDVKADKTELTKFITKSVNNLVNYYRKSETYTQQEVNELIGAIKTINMKVLPQRPAVGESNIIYLIPSEKQTTENVYDEWIYVDNKWELIGTTKVDLSNYYTKDQINTILYDYITSNDLETILNDYAKKTDIPQIKVDTNTISKNSRDELQSVGSILKSGGFQHYWKGTKNEYNAIANKDNNTLYEVLDDEETALFEVDGNTIEFSPDGLLRVPNNMDMMFQSVTYGNHESGYRKWRNGFIEQWGVATSNANGDSEFTMHQAHIDQNFSVFIEPREIGNFFHYAIPSANQKFRTRIQTRDSQNIAVKFQWHSYGYWK